MVIDMAELTGRVALVTGAARGQGRAIATRLAEEGADIIALDICADGVGTVQYPLGTAGELAGTAKAVEVLDRRIVTAQVDVRDGTAMRSAVAEGVAELGRLDIVSANAGIASSGLAWEMDDATWQDMLDVNLTGVWQTAKAALPILIEQGEGGAIVLTSSVAGLLGFGNMAHYTAAKHGVVGLMRSLVQEVSAHRIRVNTVHPTFVDTPMVHNQATYKLFFPDRDGLTRDDFGAATTTMHALETPWIEPEDIANAIAWLVSDRARFVTGATVPVDAGMLAKV